MNNEIVFYRRFGDIDGDTPLHFAAANGRYNSVIKYINAGSDINVVNNLGWTPLMQACKNGHYSSVKVLIQNGANVDANNYFGTCLLSLAVASGNLEIVKLVFKTLCGNKLLDEVLKNNQPIIYSIILRNNEILKLLLKYKFHWNQTAIGGLLPLEIAKRTNNTAAMSLLNRRGLSPLDMSKISPNNQSFLSPMMATKNTRRRISSNINISSLPSTPILSPIESKTIISKESKPRTSSNLINNFFPSTPIFSRIGCSTKNSFHASPRKVETSLLEKNRAIMATSHYVSGTTTNEFMILHPNSLTAPSFHTRRSSTTSMCYSTYQTKQEDDVFVNSPNATLRLPSQHHFVNLLRRHSLDSCVSLFEEHEIDMDLFLTLSKSDLNEIGVDWDKRDAVLELIYQLNKQKNA